MPVRFEMAEGTAEYAAVVVDIASTGGAEKIERVLIHEDA